MRRFGSPRPINLAVYAEALSGRKRVLLAVAILAFSLIAASAAFAQTVNTRVSGTVKDQAGAVVPGVKVTLTDAKTKDTSTVTTNDDGIFVFTDVRESSI